MLRLVRFSARIVLTLACLTATAQQSGLVRDGDRWRRTFTGTAPAGKRLRINAHGPVTLQAGVGNTFSYTVAINVRARSEMEARNVLSRYAVKLVTVGDKIVLTVPAGPVV